MSGIVKACLFTCGIPNGISTACRENTFILSFHCAYNLMIYCLILYSVKGQCHKCGTQIDKVRIPFLIESNSLLQTDKSSLPPF